MLGIIIAILMKLLATGKAAAAALQYVAKAEFAAGYRTYFAAFGLVCYAVYLVTIGQYDQVVKVALEAMGLMGIRAAIG